jgi:biofilm PGA synthesis N-glycosyltransferase PgaC
MNMLIELLVRDTTHLPRSEDASSAPPKAPPSTVHPPTSRRDSYLDANSKFRIALAGGLAWMLLSILVTLPWLRELRASSGPIAVLLAITAIAIIPGITNAILLVRLSTARRPRPTPPAR